MSELEQTSDPTPVAEPTPAPAPASVAPAAPAVDPAVLDTHFVSGYQAVTTPADVLAALLDGSGLVAGTVSEAKGLVISAIRFDGEPLRACLDKLARPLGATWALRGNAVDLTF